MDYQDHPELMDYQENQAHKDLKDQADQKVSVEM
jgi:hypothetical protein